MRRFVALLLTGGVPATGLAGCGMRARPGRDLASPVATQAPAPAAVTSDAVDPAVVQAVEQAVRAADDLSGSLEAQLSSDGTLPAR